MNEITEFLKNRRSVLIKTLDNAPIDEADIQEIRGKLKLAYCEVLL